MEVKWNLKNVLIVFFGGAFFFIYSHHWLGLSCDLDYPNRQDPNHLLGLTTHCIPLLRVTQLPCSPTTSQSEGPCWVAAPWWHHHPWTTTSWADTHPTTTPTITTPLWTGAVTTTPTGGYDNTKIFCGSRAPLCWAASGHSVLSRWIYTYIIYSRCLLMCLTCCSSVLHSQGSSARQTPLSELISGRPPCRSPSSPSSLFSPSASPWPVTPPVSLGAASLGLHGVTAAEWTTWVSVCVCVCVSQQCWEQLQQQQGWRTCWHCVQRWSAPYRCVYISLTLPKLGRPLSFPQSDSSVQCSAVQCSAGGCEEPESSDCHFSASVSAVQWMNELIPPHPSAALLLL